jgi:hypothetical protein
MFGNFEVARMKSYELHSETPPLIWKDGIRQDREESRQTTSAHSNTLLLLADLMLNA